jgi:molybdate transport system substrate-binding protein
MRPISKLRSVLFLVCSVATLSFSARAFAGSDAIVVYVPTSLAEAVQAAIHRYQQAGLPRIDLIVGQSGSFARAIERHAPANIFISASEPLVTGLIAKGFVDREATAAPIGNDLVLVAPVDSQLQGVSISPKLDFTQLLGPNGLLAVGDPDYTPIGIYAMAALSKLGQWDLVAPRLMRAPSAGAALKLVETGQATLGMTFATAAAASKNVKVLGRFPHTDGVRIRYSFAIVKENDGPETRKLFQFLIGAEALQIYSDHGFTGEGSPTSAPQISKPQ